MQDPTCQAKKGTSHQGPSNTRFNMAPVPDPMPGLGIIIADMAHTEYNDDFLHKFVLKPIKLTGAEPTESMHAVPRATLRVDCQVFCCDPCVGVRPWPK